MSESTTRTVKMGMGTGMVRFIENAIQTGEVNFLLGRNGDPLEERAKSYANTALIYLIGRALVDTGNEDGDITDYSIRFVHNETGEALTTGGEA